MSLFDSSDNLSCDLGLIERRKFLAYSLSIAVVSFVAIDNAEAQNAPKVKPFYLEVFVAFLDTLLPPNKSPAASDLSVHHDIIKLSKNVNNYPELLLLGGNWLYNTSMFQFGKPFEKLSLNQKNIIVSVAERAKQGSIPEVYFNRIKTDAFNFYYANPASWKFLGFDGPLQPDGFINATKPPSL